MARELEIDGRRIADDTDCFVIAEIGHNHQGNVETCEAMFRAAKEAGASAVKLQKRDNRALFTAAMYDQPYDNENSYGDTYGEHREALEFGRDEYLHLQQVAKELDVTFFATAFDLPSVDFLAELGTPAIKIASGDLRSTHLLKYAAQVGVPLVVSTGGATMDDVRRAHDTIVEINTNVALLQCTAGYPPEFHQLDLRVIQTFRDEFPETVIGYSGHDSGIAMGTVAFVLGARVIEKHFTLNRAMKGTDHAFSLEPVGMRKLVRDLQRTREALGSAEKRMHPTEQKPVMKMSKKLVARHDLAVGTVIGPDDLAMKSPGDGLWPYQIDEVVGRRLTCALRADDAIELTMLEPAS
jgi:N-acetylneuraminate synthase/sialic acid synthase